MKIGVPKEIKTREYRVGLTPSSASELVRLGHEVIVETHAGAGIDLKDEAYRKVGARIVNSAEKVFEEADLIVKVKEPQLNECAMLRPDQTLFTYLHLAADKPQAEALCKSGATCIAYETVTDLHGRLPLLAPMSEVAGRMSVQVGATALERAHGGRGVLLGGVPGVASADVVILGGGVAGENALQMAIGARARVTLFEKSLDRIAVLDRIYGARARIVYSTAAAVHEAITKADLVIGAVLIPGASAPRLISKAELKDMQPGAVLVDIAIDQGGCFETSKATTHDEPTYIVDDIVHYCVANMPGAVPRTSTFALNNATLPFVIQLAEKGTPRALAENEHLMNGLNIAGGHIVLPVVAEALDMKWAPYEG